MTNLKTPRYRRRHAAEEFQLATATTRAVRMATAIYRRSQGRVIALSVMALALKVRAQ